MNDFESPFSARNSSRGPAALEFEMRERARRAERIARLDEVADQRAQNADRHSYYARQLERLVKSLMASRERVLEVGSGLGDLLAAVGGPGSVGIDVSPRMVEHARRRHPDLDLRVLDVENDPLPEGPFDAILVSDAVGLFYDIQTALERLHGLLAPRGRLIVT